MRRRGTLGEDFACRCLQKDGYEILARNYHSSHSEIDIIARKGEIVAFVEVKMRSKTALAAPIAYVTAAQRRRIVFAAVAYLKEQGIYNTGEYQPRFDVFEVVTENAGSPLVIRHAHIPAAYDTGDLHVFV